MPEEKEAASRELSAEELMVLSSIQLFMADPDYIKPEAFGSGVIVKYMGAFFLLSVFHVIKYDDLNLFMETNLPPDENSVPVAPLGGFLYFDLLKVSKDADSNELIDMIAKGGERLDITFATVKQLPELLQPEMDFGWLKVEAGAKAYLDLDHIAEPDKSETYGFYGKIRHHYQGLYLHMQPTLKNNLKYFSSNTYFHKFVAPEIITDAKDYQGCSGAPILDSQGRLVALACRVVVPSKLIYGFSIQKCIELLDMAIKTNQI